MGMSPWPAGQTLSPGDSSNYPRGRQQLHHQQNCASLGCPSSGGSGTGMRQGEGSEVIMPASPFNLLKPLALGGMGERGFE